MRTKSLYDPCPYLYRTPTNGTYNLFPTTITAWTIYSYLGGAKWTSNSISTWLPNTGVRYAGTGLFYATGHYVGYRTATSSSASHGYVLVFVYDKAVQLNHHDWGRAEGIAIRCIEECDYNL